MPSIRKSFWGQLFLYVVCFSHVYGQHKDYPIQGVSFTKVSLTDNFWRPRIQTNYKVTLPASFERCEHTGRVKNFEMAAARSGKFCTVFPFDDTDIYKTIEGASYSLSLFPDAKLEAYIDSLIVKVGNAQEPDGYLYTARTIDPAHPHKWSGSERWVKERELSHELYNSGHLYEAAAAHFYATGKKNLLNIALRNADLVCSVFGADKLHVAPGHEVVEMGLVKLYRITGEQKYLQTAAFFINERGHYKGYDPASKDEWKNGMYWQDDKPVTDQKEAEGHAVRAGYLYAAMADVAALTGDEKMLRAIDTIWQNIVSRKMYVQGGVGAVPDGERFGEDYELPNGTAYNETCAAIAQIFWNQRMFQLHGEAKYADIIEKILYNGFISGVGLDGKSFFYTNAMEIKNGFSHKDMEPMRSGWFECSCCPTNVVRLLPSIPGYVYAQKEDTVFVNLFVSGNATMTIKGKELALAQQNNYPWDGDLKFTVSPKASMDLALLVRIPGWAQNEAMPSDLYAFEGGADARVVIAINGKEVDYKIERGYAVLSRKWKKGDVVEVRLPMDVRRVAASPNLKNNIGKVALQRGPLLYCAEWVDNNGRAANIILPEDVSFTTASKPDLLNGVVVIQAETPVAEISADGLSISTNKKQFTAIPYYSWANRGKGEMVVWFPQKVRDIDLLAQD